MTALHSEEYKRFAKLLARLRNERGVSQYELARRLGVDQSYVSKYESARRRLDVIEFLRITVALGLNPAAVVAAIPIISEAGEPAGSEGG